MDRKNDAQEPAPGQSRPRNPHPYLILGLLVGIAAALLLLLNQRTPPPPAAPPEASAPSVPSPPPAAEPPPPAPAPPSAPPKQRPAPIQPPAEFASCLPRGSTTLDNKVARCRFGTPDGAPPEATAHSKAPRGMVSAEYLARYRAERNAPPPAEPSAAIEITAKRIHHSDGKAYLAEWTVRDNRIDEASVCLNHPQTSIDYRECRKAAKAWYQAQCRYWQQPDLAESEATRQRLEERYCTAASDFRPAS